MRSIGIIGEYNPFHEGHAYLLQEGKRRAQAEVCISVMSGNFTQRGEPAFFSKWKRAQMACEKGINLVVELPTVFACNSAEFFAKGGVSVLEGFGCIDALCFGSESGDLASLREVAEVLLSQESTLVPRIAALQKEGISFPKAREEVLHTLLPQVQGSLLSEPNNILAVEYLKFIERMEPITIRRRGDGYHLSGTKIRKALTEEDPSRILHMEDAYYRMVTSMVMRQSQEDLAKVFAADFGLANKIKKEIRRADCLEDLLARLKSKVYTRTRISRFLTQLLLGITDETMREARPYVRVLAFDQCGAAFLREVKRKECCSLPIFTNINKQAHRYPEVLPTLEKDILANDLYNLITHQNLYQESDYVRMPFVHGGKE